MPGAQSWHPLKAPPDADLGASAHCSSSPFNMPLPAEVQALLDAQPPGRFSVTAEGKVKCELNGHTLPARVDALQAFLK